MSRQTQKESGRLPVGLFGTRLVTVLGPAFFWLVPGICTPTATAGPRGGLKSANALLVLQVAGDPLGRRQEQRFITELRLALDGVPVRVVQPLVPGFAGLTLARQIAAVRPLLQRHRGLAITWLCRVSPRLLLLHMVAVSAGRALVRLVETRPTRGFETDLALAARELLGTAFLFDKLPGGKQRSFARVVRSVRKRVAVKPPTAAWSVLMAAGAGGGVAGHQGPSLWAGGTLALDRRLAGGWHIRVSFSPSGGPLQLAEPKTRIWSLAPGLAGHYRWRFGRISLGVTLELQATWSNVIVDATSQSTQVFSDWGFRSSAGLELHWRLSRDFSIMAGAAMGVSPIGQTYVLRSTGRTILTTPYLDWEGRIGVVVHL